MVVSIFTLCTVKRSVKNAVKRDVKQVGFMPFDPLNVPFGESRVPSGNFTADVPVTQCIP